MRARRALLYVPGDDLHKIEKAISLAVDSIILDIEDGVAINRKSQARQIILDVLQKLDFGSSERLVRINPVGSGMEIDDLQTIITGHPDGIVLPKVAHPEQIIWASEEIAKFEKKSGWPAGEIALLALIETGQGVVNLKEIAGCDSRLQGLIFGAEDLAGDIGAVRTREGWEVFYAKSAVVVHARAFGLQAIDVVYLDFHDTDGLVAESRQAAGMAYTGKQIIHPIQVKPVQEAFTPTDEAIAQARRIVETAQMNQQGGKGAFALDGKMVDAPVVKTAEWVLARAKAAGKQ